MRKRILEELEVERKALEQELKELKEKSDEVKVERKLSRFLMRKLLTMRTFRRPETSYICCA